MVVKIREHLVFFTVGTMSLNLISTQTWQTKTVQKICIKPNDNIVALYAGTFLYELKMGWGNT